MTPLSAEELQRLRALAPELAQVIPLGAYLVLPDQAGYGGWAFSAPDARRALAVASRDPLPQEFYRFCEGVPMLGAHRGDRRRLRKAARTAALQRPEVLDLPAGGFFALTPSALLSARTCRPEAR